MLRSTSRRCRRGAVWAGVFGGFWITLGCGGAVQPLKATAASAGVLPYSAERRDWPAREVLRAEVSVLGVHTGSTSLKLSYDCGTAASFSAEGQAEGLAAMFSDRSVNTKGTLDTRTGLPLSYETRVQNGGKKATFELAFQREFYDWVKREERKTTRGRRALPDQSNAHTFESAFLMLRNWKPAAKPHESLLIVLGRRLYQLDVTFQGSEVVDHKDKKVAAVRVDGQLYKLDLLPGENQKPRAMQLWFTDDARRVPFRALASTALGDAVIDIQSLAYQPPLSCPKTSQTASSPAPSSDRR